MKTSIISAFKGSRTIRSIIPILLFFLLSFCHAEAQVNFTKHEFVKPFTRATGLCLVDLDRDGDLDVVAGSGTIGVYWYENDGYQSVGWTRHVIDNALKGCLSIIAMDIDHDGRSDLVTGSWDDNQVLWYRNNNDLTFTKTVIDGNLGNPHEYRGYDVDKDGLMDVVVAAMKTGDMVWYKNIDGGNSWVKQIISNQFTGARSISAGDIDGDGDTDLAGAAFDINEISVWKNDGGNPVHWVKSSISTTFGGAHFVEWVDFNKDGQLDLLASGYYANAVVWWENKGSDISSWLRHDVDIQLTRALVSRSADIDLDGDPDIIATGSTSNCAVWYENTDGKGLTWKKTVIDGAITSPWPILAGDIDGDIDIDIMAGSDRGNEIRWYSNQPSGKFNGSIRIPGYEMPCGFNLPAGYVEMENYELLIGFHGGGHSTMYSVLRDYLVPVTVDRHAIVVTPDFTLAASPDYNFSNPGVIRELIKYFVKRFAVDTSRIYLLGAGCQGKEVLKSSADPTLRIKGAIAVNPMFPPIQLVDWANAKRPVVIFASRSNPCYSNLLRLESVFTDQKIPVQMISYEGSPDGFLVDELPEYALEGMTFIDTCKLISSIGRDRFVSGKSHPAIVKRSLDGCTLQLTGYLGEWIDINLFDITGCFREALFSGRITSEPFEVKVPAEKVGIFGSIGFIRITGAGINQTIKTLIL